MESRRRRTPRPEDQMRRPREKLENQQKRPEQYRPWPILGWALVACALIVLAYLQGPGEFSLDRLISPIQHPHRPGPEPDNAAALRPRIELHPEEHTSRPAGTQHRDWRISSGNRRPDGVLKPVYLINGERDCPTPGPTIEARSGDTLVITVTNELQEESIALHWHGLHVANAMDGAAGVSQCTIPPGGQFVYNVTIPPDQSGTFWYHAHSGTLRADGLYGGLVVHAPAPKSTVRGLISRERGRGESSYDKELLLLIGDWYHRRSGDVLAWYQNPGNNGNEPVPDSLLVNGVGHFDCSMAVPARPLDCVTQWVNSSFLDLEPGPKYRIRVVNTGALAGISLTFDQEHLDLIQLDSTDTARSEQKDANSIGILYPGQRMDFILHSSPKASKQSSIMISLDEECFKYINPALTPEQTFLINYLPSSSSPESEAKGKKSEPTIRNTINLDDIPSSPSVLKNLPPKAQETHVVYTKIQKMARNSNMPFGYFNHTSWRTQQDPRVPLIALPRSQWDENQFSITTGKETQWVDLVVNNLDEGPHPFHLHGHHFYILTIQEATFGWGSYNPFVDDYPPGLEPDETTDNTHTNTSQEQPYDLTRASLRDTVQIPSRGYAVLRFRADNPGVWMLHCHILWHLATGMAMLIDVQGDPGGVVAHDLGRGGGVCSG
ncbi:multicopper oxidase-domain-containing protein [Penicillium lagena]|uniref:multicopper oxidase-domain-containing protein n=1 Tax=Penicillium lagena TaxID=94218 RepID=UPI0025405FC9|nr:multicopper oxidase-domain-containing protein [Penicillium lagena]KAJ5625031.1 multicopper oxidase-domain-containing protein [Penicillium lagena]